MTNREKAIEIFKILEEKHINLYHDISKEDFEVELNKFLEVADSLDKIHFDAGMCRLFSLFRDAHTRYVYRGIGNDYSQNIKFIEGKYYYYDIDRKICEEIVKINGFDIDEVIEKLSKMICYEHKSWLNMELVRGICNLRMLRMIDCQNAENNKEIKYALKNGEIIVKKEFRLVQNKDYYSFTLQDNALFINYKKCDDMVGCPFVDFVEDIKKSCGNLPKYCLIDIRNNGGGSSEPIKPLLHWLAENDIKTYVLMNNNTFSAGCWVPIYAKRRLGKRAILLGTDAGQGIYKYGVGKHIQTDEYYFTYSAKYFELKTIANEKFAKDFNKNFNKDNPIKPDVYIAEKVEDVALGIDGQLRDALEYIEKDLQLNIENEK